MNNKTRLSLCGLALMMTLNFGGCKTHNKDVNTNVSNNDISYDLYKEHFNLFMKKDIVNDRVVKQYWTYNIVIGVNKNTNEVSKYIYYYGNSKDFLYDNIMNPELLNGEIMELFDLETGKLLYFKNFDNPDLEVGENVLKDIIENNDFYFLNYFYEDIEYEYKSWYTLDEINEIASKFVDKNKKIKRLELTTK